MYLASFDLLHCNCLSSPGSCPGPDVVHRPSGLQYEINLVICYYTKNIQKIYKEYTKYTKNVKVSKVVNGDIEIDD